ncbi:hypothetical protein HPP92_003640 [Vanilla planifolia]|uniref:Uncharacterized protein n=1 Tax=Vanilla planifolia TaxID=51239 RepID=A0A835RVI0_VANPL|nr:hypothetical protein HPP92_003640 [Vanilla planifolia]
MSSRCGRRSSMNARLGSIIELPTSREKSAAMESIVGLAVSSLSADPPGRTIPPCALAKDPPTSFISGPPSTLLHAFPSRWDPDTWSVRLRLRSQLSHRSWRRYRTDAGSTTSLLACSWRRYGVSCCGRDETRTPWVGQWFTTLPPDQWTELREMRSRGRPDRDVHLLWGRQPEMRTMQSEVRVERGGIDIWEWRGGRLKEETEGGRDWAEFPEDARWRRGVGAIGGNVVVVGSGGNKAMNRRYIYMRWRGEGGCSTEVGATGRILRLHSEYLPHRDLNTD